MHRPACRRALTPRLLPRPPPQRRSSPHPSLQGRPARPKTPTSAAPRGRSQRPCRRGEKLRPRRRAEPRQSRYALALIVVREHHLDELVQLAARQRLLGNNERADALLEEARKIDPNNAVIAQHFEEPASASEFSPQHGRGHARGRREARTEAWHAGRASAWHSARRDSLALRAVRHHRSVRLLGQYQCTGAARTRARDLRAVRPDRR